jgi:hypothetical protein
MVGIDSVPVFRSRSPDKDEWLTPPNFVYDKTAGVIGHQESKLAGITDPFQAIALRDLLRIGTEYIGVARTKTKKERQKCDAQESPEQIIIPQFRWSEWKHHCVAKFEQSVVSRSVGTLASKIVRIEPIGQRFVYGLSRVIETRTGLRF